MVTVTGDHGTGDADVINAAPSITALTVLNADWSATTTLIPNTMMYYNVTVLDTDGFVDVENVTIEIVYSGNFGFDDPMNYYLFGYNATTAIWYQELPSAGLYINSLASSATMVTPTTGNFSFAITLNKTAQDTNGLANWHGRATIMDLDGITATSTLKNYVMSPFVEETYWGNAGGNNFLWTSMPETTSTVTFYTLVTSNDKYELNCSYTGYFAAPWGSPELTIKQSSQTIWYAVINASATSNTNITWYTSPIGVQYMHNISHDFRLVFPAGITKDTTYSGVIIWIQARND